MRVDLHRCIIPSFYIVVQLAVPYASRHAGLDTTTNRTSRQSVGGKAVTNHRRRTRHETVMTLTQMRYRRFVIFPIKTPSASAYLRNSGRNTSCSSAVNAPNASASANGFVMPSASPPPETVR